MGRDLKLTHDQQGHTTLYRAATHCQRGSLTLSWYHKGFKWKEGLFVVAYTALKLGPPPLCAAARDLPQIMFPTHFTIEIRISYSVPTFAHKSFWFRCRFQAFFILFWFRLLISWISRGRNWNQKTTSKTNTSSSQLCGKSWDAGTAGEGADMYLFTWTQSCPKIFKGSG